MSDKTEKSKNRKKIKSCKIQDSAAKNIILSMILSMILSIILYTGRHNSIIQ